MGYRFNESAAPVINFNELIKFESYNKAKEKGAVRTEGKDYAVKDGDVMFFRTGA